MSNAIHDDSKPLGFGSSAELGPDERAKLDALLDHIYEYGTNSEGVLRLAAQLCQAARADERERCAKVCDLHSRLTWNDDRRAQSRVLAAEIRRGA